jgi:hypothetical protein
MPNEPERELTLAEIEEAVLAEGREWTRQRLQQKLQEQAHRIGRSFPPGDPPPGALSKKKAHAAKQRRAGRA